jgi:hypothetical protein
MSDDIVTRLQKGNAHYGDLQTDPDIYQDALNEIERLRVEVMRWKNLAADLAMELAMTDLAVSDES